MTQVPLAPPPPTGQPIDGWLYLLWRRLMQAGQVLWGSLDFSGSNLTDLETRNHADLQNIDTATYTHLTATQATDLTDGGTTALHTHTSGIASSITVADAAGDTSTFLVLAGAATGNESPLTDSGLTYDATNNVLKLSDGNAVAAALVTSDKFIMSYLGTAPSSTFVVASATDIHRGIFKAVRARGTLDTPTVPSANDYVLSFLGTIFDGVTGQGTAAVDFFVDGAVSAGVAPQRISFVTSATTGAARTERLSISSTGAVSIVSTLSVGGQVTSTLATGTAPLVIASTTKVANLNVDLLDDQSGTYYLDAGNFTGTNWTDLTDAGDSTLHYHASDRSLANTTGLGTGVGTALAIAVGSAGAPVINGGVLGTPSSGTVTNLTGTASININGTVGATTPAAGAFTTLSATGVTTVQAGTALLPAITPSGDPNTGVWFPAADTVAVSTGGTERMRINSSGEVGIGVTPVAGQSVVLGKTITGSIYSYGIQQQGIIQSDVTSIGNYYRTYATTAAASFTLATLPHYSAEQGALGAGSSVTSQSGFYATASLIGATNNYGFYGNIASGTGRWNFYASGTADNAYAGNSSFGQVVAPIAAVDTTSFATNLVTNTGATYTVLTTDHTIIQTTAASVYTLPAASSFTGRILHLVTQFAGTVTSASSNVVPIAGGAAGTAILAATAGKFATLQSNGTSWIIIASN